MFTLESFFNPYLSSGKTRLDAVLTITANSSAASSTQARVVGFVMDVSGSMEGEKLHAAKIAVRNGVDLLDADTNFFVIAYNLSVSVVVPVGKATRESKARAHRAIQELVASNGTALSCGLRGAWQQVADLGEAIASVYFLTDGQNGGQDKDELTEAIEECKGVFQCDCRGVGTDWEPKEIRRISDALLGTADAVPDPGTLADDFRAFLERSLSKGVSSATLRLWSPKSVKVSAVKQVSPEILDLLPLAKRVDEKTLDIPVGAWGTEARDYQLTFELGRGEVGEEMLACRAALIYLDAQGEQKVPCGPIAATWSEDEALTTRINREVAHYTGQGELAAAIQDGLEAQARGEEEAATRLLGRAAQIAESTGNEEVTRRLKKVVDVVDGSAGTVRLKRVDKGASMELEMGGTRTVRRRPTAPGN